MQVRMPPQRPPPMCHRMSGFLFEKSKSIIASPEGNTVRVFRCVGSDCAIFVEEMNEKGQPVVNRGLCGDKVQAIAAARQATVMEMQFQQDAEDRAADEAADKAAAEAGDEAEDADATVPQVTPIDRS